MTRREHGLLWLLVALGAGCSLPSATFTPDLGDAAIDAAAAPAIEVSMLSLHAHEGVPMNVEVRLNQPPMEDTIVAIEPGGPVLDVTPAALTFSTTNWSVLVPVTVTAPADDSDANHATSSVSFSAPGYAGALLQVEIEDDDLLNAQPSVSACIDNVTTLTPIKLNGEPLTPTTVSISGANADLDVTPSSLVFTQSDFATSQQITLKPLTSQNRLVMLTVSAPGQTTKMIGVNVIAAGECP